MRSDLENDVIVHDLYSLIYSLKNGIKPKIGPFTLYVSHELGIFNDVLPALNYIEEKLQSESITFDAVVWTISESLKEQYFRVLGRILSLPNARAHYIELSSPPDSFFIETNPNKSIVQCSIDNPFPNLTYNGSCLVDFLRRSNISYISVSYMQNEDVFFKSLQFCTNIEELHIDYQIKLTDESAPIFFESLQNSHLKKLKLTLDYKNRKKKVDDSSLGKYLSKTPLESLSCVTLFKASPNVIFGLINNTSLIDIELSVGFPVEKQLATNVVKSNFCK